MEMSVTRRARIAPSQRGESVGIIAGRGFSGLGSVVPFSGAGSWAAHIQQTPVGMGSIVWIVSILLLLGHSAVAAEKQSREADARAKSEPAVRAEDVNDPNSAWWAKWDVKAKDPNDPNQLLAVKWEAIVKVLENRDLDQKLKERIIDHIVSPAFDFELMGQLALGRTHWPKLDAAQRKKFVDLFTHRLKALYLEKTSLYRNQKTILKPGERRKNQVLIPMTLISEDGEITLLYKLNETNDPAKIKMGGRWKIYDVEINGVSILLTYRSQFDDILRRGTVQDLLAQLEKPPSQ